jgi:hypothetical protein
LIPTVAAAIAGNGPDGWVPVAALVLAMSLLAAVAIATARETFNKSLPEIDGHMAEITPQARRRERPAHAGSLRHERGMKLPASR